jgi:hypothetical protein
MGRCPIETKTTSSSLGLLLRLKARIEAAHLGPPFCCKVEGGWAEGVEWQNGIREGRWRRLSKMSLAKVELVVHRGRYSLRDRIKDSADIRRANRKHAFN